MKSKAERSNKVQCPNCQGLFYKLYESANGSVCKYCLRDPSRGDRPENSEDAGQ